ncbi:MAG: PAS domain S-box protein, partial [Bacteroidota bacterium]|nr:PAS domain S-box protein [Bacteroidota bacterium]MDX5431438.1 PAS domain S-box protein [Bacteroidota bacterium]MDX5470166.1 PAS domain S-box protein [Bacteroidota bacterium]
MSPSLRKEIQHILDSFHDDSEWILYHQLRDALLKHSFFDQLLQSESDSLIDFNGLSAAIESSVLLAKVSTDGSILKVNENFYVLTGYEPGELEGESIAFLSAGLHDEAYLGEIWNKITHGSIWRGEVKKRTKQGQVIWLNATIVPVVNEKGTIEHFISIYIDISKRKKAEGDLEMFLHMVDLTNDAIQVATESGVLAYVNQRASLNLGFAREELIGKNVIEIEHIFESDEDWKAHVEEVKRHPNGILVEGVNVRKNGSKFPVEVNARWMQFGGEGYIVAVLRDITERKRSEELMQRTQYILSEAQLLAKIASFEVDLDLGTILHSENAWEVFQFDSPEEFNIETLGHRIHPDDVERIKKMWFEASSQKNAVRAEFRIKTKEGREEHILGIAQTLLRKEEGAGVMICTAQNITDSVLSKIELEQRTWELEIRNAELDQFAQIVSHDLKSPLRAIYNLSEWIKETRNDEREMDTHISMLQKRIQRMENLINGILSYSSAGKKKESQSYFSASEVLEDICEYYRTVKDNVTFIVDDMPDLLEDRLAFEQVMSNLISNAVKHNHSKHP